MQLIARTRDVRTALATATCSLLSIESAHAGFTNALESVRNVNAAVLYYSEKDRVSVVEPVLEIKSEIGDGEFITAKGVFDTMSGATPNGAIPTNAPQSFSSPSGQSTDTTPAHQLPLVAFRDERAAVGVDWEHPFTREFRGIFSGNFSRETDYTSLGASASLLWDFNNKLTTLTLGTGASLDTVNPTGGLTTPLTPVSTTTLAPAGAGVEAEGEDGGGGGGGSKTKKNVDVLIGITQVLTRSTLMQLNYGRGTSRGYLTDPYKVVTLANATTGTTTGYVHEGRPSTRARNTVFWKGVHQFKDDVVNVSYRYYWDDWGIKSQTVDLTYRFELSSEHYLEPHLRYYTQTAADFFTYSINGGTLPAYASADLRLAAFKSKTVGLRYGFHLTDDTEIGFGVDSMRQTGDAHPAAAIGVQKNEKLFTDLKALSILGDISIKF